MTGLIFCKFDHETTLQAHGSRIRLFRGGYDPGATDYHLSGGLVICGAVNVYEGVVHLLTTDGVYEMGANVETGALFRRIGPELP